MDYEKFAEFLLNKEPSIIDYIEAMEFLEKHPEYKAQWIESIKEKK